MSPLSDYFPENLCSRRKVLTHKERLCRNYENDVVKKTEFLILPIGITGSKPEQVRFLDFWAQILTRIAKNLVLHIYDTSLANDIDLSMKYK